MFLASVLLLYFIISATGNVSKHSTEKYISGDNRNVTQALQFLEDENIMAAEMNNKIAIASWNSESNITKENEKVVEKIVQEEAKRKRKSWENATSFAWKEFKDTNETIYRWFKFLSVLGGAALTEEEFQELNMLLSGMQVIYNTAKVCRFDASPDDECDLSFNPDLLMIMLLSQNYDELKHVWSQWRDKTGKKMKEKFLKYIDLNNKIAHLNGFRDAGELWKEEYESDTFEQDVIDLLKTLEPVYKHIHAFVRRKLIEQYTDKNIQPDGPIPAHLFRSMGAEIWKAISSDVQPFPEKKSGDVTDKVTEKVKVLKSKNCRDASKKLTPLGMFEMAEEFFTSLGLLPMTPEFWNRSIFEKPTDREMGCHPSSWNFHDGKDFRIKMCTVLDVQYFITIHHEMGHIEYYMHYKDQPVVFRQAANPGFHESIGDVISLSVSTPKHLEKIGFLEKASEDEEADINNLMETALDKIAFLPFGYLVDAWRWKVFSGEINAEELNSKWWDLRLKYQGICPPVKRTNEDFDPGSIYHVASSTPYIRYFVSNILEFQIHKSLCDAAGHKGPLHKCDIYQNKKAGKLLGDMMRLGRSVHWSKAMSVITGGKTEKMDAGPILEYFEPLIKWLKKQNENETLGWKSNDPMICP